MFGMKVEDPVAMVRNDLFFFNSVVFKRTDATMDSLIVFYGLLTSILSF